MLWDRQILLPSIARAVGGLTLRSLRSTMARDDMPLACISTSTGRTASSRAGGVSRLLRRHFGVAQLHAARLGGLKPRLGALADHAALLLGQRGSRMAAMLVPRGSSAGPRHRRSASHNRFPARRAIRVMPRAWRPHRMIEIKAVHSIVQHESYAI